MHQLGEPVAARADGAAVRRDGGHQLACACLLALAATVPLIFLRPAAAAVAITAANVLFLAAFAAPTVAALAAQIIASYRLGSAGMSASLGGSGRADRMQASWRASVRGAAASPYAGAWLTMPFVVLALTSHGSVAAVLLAAFVPTAAGTGIALRARREARDTSADREALAETLTSAPDPRQRPGSAAHGERVLAGGGRRARIQAAPLASDSAGTRAAVPKRTMFRVCLS